MRMAPHHLLVNGGRNVIDGELAALFGDLGIKDNLEEQVAEFVPQFMWPSFARGLDGFESFVCFFQQHWRERRISLFTIPGAALRGAQTLHEMNQVVEC